MVVSNGLSKIAGLGNIAIVSGMRIGLVGRMYSCSWYNLSGSTLKLLSSGSLAGKNPASQETIIITTKKSNPSVFSVVFIDFYSLLFFAKIVKNIESQMIFMSFFSF